MDTTLEKEIDRAYWGYIFMDDKGQFKHKLRTSSNPFIKYPNFIRESIMTCIRVFWLPRKLSPYRGMVSWHHLSEDKIWLDGMVNHNGRSLKEIGRLYNEFETVARYLEVDYIYTTVIRKNPEKLMLRLGWEPAKSLVGGRYRKKLTYSNERI